MDDHEVGGAREATTRRHVIRENRVVGQRVVGCPDDHESERPCGAEEEQEVPVPQSVGNVTSAHPERIEPVDVQYPVAGTSRRPEGENEVPPGAGPQIHHVVSSRPEPLVEELLVRIVRILREDGDPQPAGLNLRCGH